MSPRWTTALGLVAALSLLSAVGAAPPAAAPAEIAYLLGFVGKSGCEFYRNGGWYDSKTAEDHLRYKYQWLVQRGEISTAEDFIEKVATKSSLSGQPYKLRCSGGPVMTANDWMRIVLGRYRSAGGH